VKSDVLSEAVFYFCVLLSMAFFLPLYAFAGECGAEVECGMKTRDGHFIVNLAPIPDKIPMREYHDWIVEVQDSQGRPTNLDSLSISGGMPGHGHGLPSQPIVDKHLGEGRYRVSGFLFNMAGDWFLRLHLVKSNVQDIAETTFSLDY